MSLSFVIFTLLERHFFASREDAKTQRRKQNLAPLRLGESHVSEVQK
jgi:hypothetical protein